MLEGDLMASFAVLCLLVYVVISLWFFSMTVGDKRLRDHFGVTSKTAWEDKCWVMGVWWFLFLPFVWYVYWDLNRNSNKVV
jgi:hypothetical protein